MLNPDVFHRDTSTYAIIFMRYNASRGVISRGTFGLFGAVRKKFQSASVQSCWSGGPNFLKK
jgi:hypothetical protein